MYKINDPKNVDLKYNDQMSVLCLMHLVGFDYYKVLYTGDIKWGFLFRKDEKLKQNDIEVMILNHLGDKAFEYTLTVYKKDEKLGTLEITGMNELIILVSNIEQVIERCVNGK